MKSDTRRYRTIQVRFLLRKIGVNNKVTTKRYNNSITQDKNQEKRNDSTNIKSNTMKMRISQFTKKNAPAQKSMWKNETVNNTHKKASK